MIDLSIIIVSWNVADLLAACLQSIKDSPVDVVPPEGAPAASSGRLSVEVIVVDSASTDSSAEVLAKFPWVKAIMEPENVGFTRGNNIALQQARGRHMLLLNPDTEVIGDALPVMVGYLDENPAVGIVGPHTLNTDGTTQSTRRNFPTMMTALFESTWLQPLAPRRVLRDYYVSDAPDDAVLSVGWVQGSALMARRAVYEQIGGLDERFVMYSEEMDWCKRAVNAGWQVAYVGTARITHHGGRSTDQVVARRHIYFQQSKVRYFRKHHGARASEFLRFFLLANYVWQWLREWVRFLVGHKRAMRIERMAAYREVLRTGLKVEG